MWGHNSYQSHGYSGHGQGYGGHSYGGSSYGGGSYGGHNHRDRGSSPAPSSQPFQKNFYREHPSAAARTPHEIQKFLTEGEITIQGHGAPKPAFTFEENGFPERVVQDLYKAGFKAPTPIQKCSWPIALSGRDMIGIAMTGSGKTVAFLLPSFVHMAAQPPLARGDGPMVLVLAPTRELANQIQGEVQKFGKAANVRSSCVYGGAPRGPQASDLRSGVEIVVATPGRLQDFMDSNTIRMNRITYLVLDEADRMLDMGFEPQIRKITRKIRSDRQTLLFSATWPREVQSLARDLCQEDPVHVTIGSSELKANANIRQQVAVMSQYDKPRELQNLMQHIGRVKTLIFTETKRGADELAMTLSRQSIPCASIHGDKEQRERDTILRNFTSGRIMVLIATDVASRGLHIDDIQAVVNYDFPVQVEDYIHRIGRTGRAGRSGSAYTFFTEKNARYAADLVKIMEGANQQVPQELRMLVGRGGPARSSRYGGPSRKGGKGGKGGGKGSRSGPYSGGRPGKW